MAEFQTLSEFLQHPFGNKFIDTTKLEQAYSKMKLRKAFKVNGFTQVDDNFLIHVSVPSDSNQNQTYDVVVLFFTDDETIKKRTTFSNYYVKFFSNSPSFIYQYAYLYKEQGFLIDSLQDKLDANYSNQAPIKTNQSMKISFDKSIYCACRLILENPLYTNRFGINLKHRKSKDRFFQDIKSFENIKMTNELNALDKKLNRELSENKKKKSNRSSGKKEKKTSTVGSGAKSGVHRNQKIKPKKGTKSTVTGKKSIRRIPKK